MSTRTYEVRLQGPVSTAELAGALHHVEIAEHEFRTVLCGQFADQAELYDFLKVLRSYGLEVVEIRRMPPTPDPPSADEGQP